MTNGPYPTRTVLQRVWVPLVLYHAMILVGAYCVFVGYAHGPRWFEALGGVLIASGIVVQGAVIGWSIRMVRTASIRSRGPNTSSRDTPLHSRCWQCIRCGKVGTGPDRACPACGGPTIARPVSRCDGEATPGPTGF